MSRRRILSKILGIVLACLMVGTMFGALPSTVAATGEYDWVALESATVFRCQNCEHYKVVTDPWNYPDTTALCYVDRGQRYAWTGDSYGGWRKIWVAPYSNDYKGTTGWIYEGTYWSRETKTVVRAKTTLKVYSSPSSGHYGYIYSGQKFHYLGSSGGWLEIQMCADTAGGGAPHGWVRSGPEDNIPPTVDAFSITPHSVTLGNAFTISYTVSDTGGSDLNRVELWRKSETVDWKEIKRTPLTGIGNGPYLGSFSDVPSLAGTYWYGIHVVDNAGNWAPEDSPIEVEVTKPNNPPNRPHNIEPSDRATGIALTPTLRGSAFSDPDPRDTHWKTWWDIRRDDNNALVWDSGWRTFDLTSTTVPSGKLDYNTRYKWRVRYIDNHGTWSEPSPVATTFTTLEAPNQPPTAYIDSISPNPATQGQTVSFSGHGADPDGDSITAYGWRSSVDGFLSSSASFSKSDLSVGTHTIYFKVRDSHNTWSDEATKSLIINRAPQVGTINVSTNLDQATFTITGPRTYHGSGKSWSTSDAPAGTYTITYGEVSGYNTPSSETEGLTAGGSITFSGTYIKTGLYQLPATSGKISWFSSEETGSPGAWGEWLGENLGTDDATKYWYCAMRWPYYDPDTGFLDLDAKAWWHNKKILVTNPANGKQVILAAKDWGPAQWTGRVIDVSKTALDALGAVTDDVVNIEFADQSAPLGPISRFSIGDRVRTTVDVGLWVRSDHYKVDGNEIWRAPDESTGVTTSGPESGSGYIWWKIRYDVGIEGWSAEADASGDFLEKYAPPHPVADAFQYPLTGTWAVSQDFGIWNSDWGGYHLAEDVLADAYTPVYASGKGKVRFTSTSISGYGSVIIIEHRLPNNSYVCTLYGHLSGSKGLKVNVGDYVSEGQLIGYIGNSSENGGYIPHIHFGIRKGGYSTESDYCGKWLYVGYSRSCSGCTHVRYRDMWHDPTDFVGPPPTYPHPVLTSSLEITPVKDKYYVGDTLIAKFTITNEGTAPITFDVLTVGGRFNDGKLPNGEYPDFTWSRNIVLNPDGSHQYQGSLILNEAGSYHFFCAYRTPDGNWNPSVDLGEGLSDQGRIEDISVSSLPEGLGVEDILTVLDAYFMSEPSDLLGGKVPAVDDIFNLLDAYFGS